MSIKSIIFTSESCLSEINDSKQILIIFRVLIIIINQIQVLNNLWIQIQRLEFLFLEIIEIEVSNFENRFLWFKKIYLTSIKLDDFEKNSKYLELVLCLLFLVRNFLLNFVLNRAFAGKFISDFLLWLHLFTIRKIMNCYGLYNYLTL